MNWEKRQKFSIRKFSIGAASVMIGQFYLGTVANAPSVSADERTSAGVETVSQPQESEMSNVTLPDQASATNQETSNQETSNPDTDKVSSEASAEKNTAESSQENAVENEKAQNTTSELSPAQALSQLAKETAEKLPSGKVEEGSQANQTSEPSESAKQNSEEVTKEKTAETAKEENSAEKTADLSKEETVNYDVTYKDIDTGEVVYRDVRQATIPAGKESVTVKSEGKELVNEAALGNYADESGESLVRTATIKRGQTASLTYLVKAFQNDDPKPRAKRKDNDRDVVHRFNGTVNLPTATVGEEYPKQVFGRYDKYGNVMVGTGLYVHRNTIDQLAAMGLKTEHYFAQDDFFYLHNISGKPTKPGTIGINDYHRTTPTPGGGFSPIKNTYLLTVAGGASGSKGDKGETGPKGDTGATGAPGKSFLSGTAAPDNSHGQDGDTFLNSTTGDVYTKTNGTWQLSGNIKGPKGDKGDTGAAGKDGATGAKGADGKSFHTGVTIPDPNLGNNGDSYLNITTGDIYNKTGGQWQKIGELKGPKGEKGDKGDAGVAGKDGATGAKGDKGDAGKDGKSIISGTNTPTNTIGKDGDVYLNFTTGDLYYKDNGAWSPVGNIKGAKGDTGAAGQKGNDGRDGKDGNTVTTSGLDPVASQGKDGDTHINTVTGDLFTKSNGQWTKTGAIKGPKGDKGDTGPAGGGSGSGSGPAGKDGKSITISSTTTDAQGNTIITFSDGTSVTIRKGDKGDKGDTGVAGKDGTTGAQGADGHSITSGPGAPNNANGKDGDLYVDINTGDLYRKDNGTWKPNGTIKGAKGDKGDTGPAGPAGKDGSGKTINSGNGQPNNSQGKDGDLYYDKGTGQLYYKDNGVWKPIDIKGQKGDKGDTGAPGKDGLAGRDGSNGTNGKDGKSILSGTGKPSNTTGIDGDLYLDSTTGDLYFKDGGAWKPNGNLKGSKGDAGAAGKDGLAGRDGTNGTNGTNGKDGKSILSGTGKPSNTTGIDGDLYLDSTTGDLYFKDGGTWKPNGNLKGSKGDKGDTGATGPQGPKGQDGTHALTITKTETDGNGNTIITFSDGSKVTIPKGAKGDKGDTGASGPQGPKGDTGAAGK